MILMALSRIQPSPSTLIWLRGLLWHPEWYHVPGDMCYVDQLPVASRAQQTDWYVDVGDFDREVFGPHWILRNVKYLRQYLVVGGRLEIPISREDTKLISSLLPDWNSMLPLVSEKVNIDLWEKRPEELILLGWEGTPPPWSRWSDKLQQLVVKVRYGLTSDLECLISQHISLITHLQGKCAKYCSECKRVKCERGISKTMQEVVGDKLSVGDAISVCLGEVVRQVDLFRGVLLYQSDYIRLKYRKLLSLVVQLIKLGNFGLDTGQISYLLERFPWVQEIAGKVVGGGGANIPQQMMVGKGANIASQLLPQVEREQQRKIFIKQRRKLQRNQARIMRCERPIPPGASVKSNACDPACDVMVVGVGVVSKCNAAAARPAIPVPFQA